MTKSGTIPIKPGWLEYMLVLKSLLWCLVYVIRAPYTLGIRLPLLEMMCVVSRGWSLATITCVKLNVGPITHVESYSQVHKSWRTGSCLPFGNCKCYYLYFVKCLFLFLFVCSVVALVLSLFGQKVIRFD